MHASPEARGRSRLLRTHVTVLNGPQLPLLRKSPQGSRLLIGALGGLIEAEIVADGRSSMNLIALSGAVFLMSPTAS